MNTYLSFPSVWVCDKALGKLFLFPASYFP